MSRFCGKYVFFVLLCSDWNQKQRYYDYLDTIRCFISKTICKLFSTWKSIFFLSLLKLSSVYCTQFLRGRGQSKQDFPKKTIIEQETKSEEAEANLDHGASLNNEVMYEELFLEFLFCAWLWNHRFKCFEGMYRIHCVDLILSFKKFSLKYCDVLIYFRISFLILVFWFYIVEVRKRFTFHYPLCWDLLSKSFSWFHEF